jgi:hypothetical protein
VGAAEGVAGVDGVDVDGVELPESLEDVDEGVVEPDVELDDEDDDEPDRLSVL